MTTVTDQDLQQLKDLITAGNAATGQQIAAMQQQMADLTLEMRAGFAEMDKRMTVGFAKAEGDIKALDQRVSALDDRIKTQDGKFWTLVTIILGTCFTLLIKILGFPNV